MTQQSYSWVYSPKRVSHSNNDRGRKLQAIYGIGEAKCGGSSSCNTMYLPDATN